MRALTLPSQFLCSKTGAKPCGISDATIQMDRALFYSRCDSLRGRGRGTGRPQTAV